MSKPEAQTADSCADIKKADYQWQSVVGPAIDFTPERIYQRIKRWSSVGQAATPGCPAAGQAGRGMKRLALCLASGLALFVCDMLNACYWPMAGDVAVWWHFKICSPLLIASLKASGEL